MNKAFSNTARIFFFIILILINFLFAYKYSSRSINHSLLVSLIYSLFLIGLYFGFRKTKIVWIESNWFYYSIVIAYSVAHIILFRFIPVESINVDRWSVISSFWDEAFKGHYPYNALSHMENYPGPLPFYFLLALPFYMIHEIGYLSLIGIILFAIFLRKNLRPSESISALIFLVLSISIMWEMSARSTIFINAVLFMFFLFRLQTVNLNKNKEYLLSAFVAGLILSTRTLFAFPLIIYCVYLFKTREISLNKLTGWIIGVLSVFMTTFLPFVIFHFQDFLTRNPFSVQTEHLLSLPISLAFLVLAFAAGFVCRDKGKIILLTAGIFVLLFIVYSAFKSHGSDFISACLNSKVDISYSLFAYPFLLYYSFKSQK